jgi:hypothetical protein
MTDADRPIFARAFVGLALALREKAADAAVIAEYFKALLDLPVEFVVEGAERWKTRAQWFPKTSEWRAAAVSLEAERAEAQRAFLRRLPSPLCRACDDTSWAQDDEGRVRPCECRQQRRQELLGRLPWPALSEGEIVSRADDPTVADPAKAIAALEGLGFRLGLRTKPPMRADEQEHI